jgi:hypothetical protein
VQVTGELFKQQMVAVTLGAAGAGALALPADKGLVPDTASWGCLVQLYGVLGQWRQVSDVVLAAVRQQLPGVGKDGVEAVLAGAAAALMAAGRHTAAVQLLDGLVAAGVTAVSHPELAQQLVEAADQSTDAEQVGACTSVRWSACTAARCAACRLCSYQQVFRACVSYCSAAVCPAQELVCRLAAGDEALYEALPDVAAGGCRGTVVVLVQQDAGLAMKKLINNMSN